MFSWLIYACKIYQYLNILHNVKVVYVYIFTAEWAQQFGLPDSLDKTKKINK